MDKKVSEHTPTPWHVSGVRSKLGGLPVLSIVGADEKCNVMVLYSDRTTKEHTASHADANLIVNAVNNHGALVKALTQIDTLATCTGVVDPALHRNMLDDIYYIAREALRKASGLLPDRTECNAISTGEVNQEAEPIHMEANP